MYAKVKSFRPETMKPTCQHLAQKVTTDYMKRKLWFVTHKKINKLLDNLRLTFK